MLTREARPVELAERAGSSARMAWPGGKMEVSDPKEVFAKFFQNMVGRGVTPNPAQLQRAVELGIDSASSSKRVKESSGKREKRTATDRQRSKASSTGNTLDDWTLRRGTYTCAEQAPASGRP